jgi:hypothetical protein
MGHCAPTLCATFGVDVKNLLRNVVYLFGRKRETPSLSELMLKQRRRCHVLSEADRDQKVAIPEFSRVIWSAWIRSARSWVRRFHIFVFQ